MLNNEEISSLCRDNDPENNMISPFLDSTYNVTKEERKVPSYGLSYVGYDIRLYPDDFRIFTNTYKDHINLREDYASCLKKITPVNGDVFIPPNSYALGVSLEKFNIPHNIVGKCIGKSTFARMGIIVNVAPLEPGWKGHLTIEISNSCPLRVYIPIYGGIAQIQFEKINTPSYLYSGKYQNQKGLELGKL